MSEYYLGVDLGTTAIKVVLYDVFGNMVSKASEEVELIKSSPFIIDQSPRCWYENPCKLIKKLCKDLPAGTVKAIGISSQGISVLPVDSEFHPLRNAISWLDTRADKELEFILSYFSEEELFCITGKHPSVLYSLPKILFIKNNCPEIFETAKMFLMPMDYFTVRLCSNAVTDATMAGGTMLYDISERKWNTKICNAFGIPESKLPHVLPTASLAGYLNKESLGLTGLSGNVAVAVGAQDQKISAYGVGIENGTVTVSLGTAGALEIPCRNKSDVLPSFVFDTGKNTYYVLEGCINTFGASIKWIRDNVCVGLSYHEMDILAENSDPGSNGIKFYPHLSGVSTPHNSKCPHSGWKDLSLATSRGDLIRSVYEGLASEIKMNLEAAEKAGAEICKLKLFGGGSKSDILCRIICDMCGINVEAFDFTEISSFGGAKSAYDCLHYDLSNDFPYTFNQANSRLRKYVPSVGYYTEFYKSYCKEQIF